MADITTSPPEKRTSRIMKWLAGVRNETSSPLLIDTSPSSSPGPHSTEHTNGLMDLPPEIRDQIWSLLLLSSNTSHRFAPQSRSGTWHERSDVHKSLRATSRQLYHEVEDVFLNKARILHRLSTHRKSVLFVGARKCDAGLERMRHLALDCVPFPDSRRNKLYIDLNLKKKDKEPGIVSVRRSEHRLSSRACMRMDFFKKKFVPLVEEICFANGVMTVDDLETLREVQVVIAIKVTELVCGEEATRQHYGDGYERWIVQDEKWIARGGTRRRPICL